MIGGIAGALGPGARDVTEELLEGLSHRAGDAAVSVAGDAALGAVFEGDVSIGPGVRHECCGGFGGYAEVSLEDGEPVLRRDPVGAKPLFYAQKGDDAAFCTERGPLWSAGFRGVGRVPQGGTLRIKEDLSVQEVGRERFGARELTDPASQELLSALEEATEVLTEDVGEVGVAFSGGVDSSATAALLREQVDVTTFNVGLEGSRDVTWSREAADLLGVELVQRTMSREEVYGAVDDVILTIGDADRMKVGVALPLLATAELMGEHGVDAAFAGQGSDELLGGYVRIQNAEDPGAEMRMELGRMGSRNLERDEHCFAANGLDLRCPFLTRPVIETALSIAVEEKVGTIDGEEFGKVVLRRAMRDVLPDPIRLKPKKAVQYGTLVDRELDRLARRRGFKRRRGRHVQRFLNDRARELGLPGAACVDVRSGSGTALSVAD
ncbi:MAG: hypothetical protein MAG715_01031 [Methanonatronarchaeales archaeon]|nr:hypothetical protein [Methanonatronarchaeales archaeon]